MTDDYSAEREAIAQFCAREGWPVPHEALLRQTDTARWLTHRGAIAIRRTVSSMPSRRSK